MENKKSSKLKEKLIVLAKTYPAISQKYESLVCVGGVKENAAFRRIYPIPWEVFWNNKGFRKKHWIEYELEKDEPSDHRQESRKINFKSISQLRECPFSEIKSILDSKLTSVEELVKINHTEISMGVVKPEIIDFFHKPNPHYEKNMRKTKQKTLTGEKSVKTDIIPWSFSYVFKCSPSCPKKHTMMCEDWEVYELYRNCKKYEKNGTYKDEEEVLEKVKLKLFDKMKEKKVVYFILGTHYRFSTYFIISIVYSTKKDKI